MKKPQVFTPGPDNDIVKFWWNEEKKIMTRKEAIEFLEAETAKAPASPAQSAKELKAELQKRDLKIEELEDKMAELLKSLNKK